MHVVHEYASVSGWENASAWASQASCKAVNAILAGIHFTDCHVPLVTAVFQVPGCKTLPLLDAFPGTRYSVESLAEWALYPRLHPEGFPCVAPDGLAPSSPAYARWEEYCKRAEREYITIAKKLSAPETAISIVPASVANSVTIEAPADILYRAIYRVLQRFAEDPCKPLRPLFRSLLEEARQNCEPLFGSLYDRFITYTLATQPGKDDEDAQVAGKGEGN